MSSERCLILFRYLVFPIEIISILLFGKMKSIKESSRHFIGSHFKIFSRSWGSAHWILIGWSSVGCLYKFLKVPLVKRHSSRCTERIKNEEDSYQFHLYFVNLAWNATSGLIHRDGNEGLKIEGTRFVSARTLTPIHVCLITVQETQKNKGSFISRLQYIHKNQMHRQDQVIVVMRQVLETLRSIP